MQRWIGRHSHPVVTLPWCCLGSVIPLGCPWWWSDPVVPYLAFAAQVVSLFSSFGFEWPVQLNSLFAASSMSTFNDQLIAPECSIGSWSFELK